jgi:hypothetical protein
MSKTSFFFVDILCLGSGGGKLTYYHHSSVFPSSLSNVSKCHPPCWFFSLHLVINNIVLVVSMFFKPSQIRLWTHQMCLGGINIFYHTYYTWNFRWLSCQSSSINLRQDNLLSRSCRGPYPLSIYKCFSRLVTTPPTVFRSTSSKPQAVDSLVSYILICMWAYI